ncbi:MAG: AbrB/MazE/SpoVT family DNA-binding domain-containing protein [Eubacteriaceae bacterium]|nr:AbrB/MazE/SpoVT family DNA-binding domain-containing protein [Eubacteriaceae bacterium]
MLAEIRSKSQITLPKEIVSSMGLSEGDKLEIFQKDGTIYMIPVTVYPKGYIDDLKAEVSQLKDRIRSGEQPVFDSIDALFEKLDGKDA